MPEWVVSSLGVVSVAGGWWKAQAWVATGGWGLVVYPEMVAILSYLRAGWVSSDLRPIAAIAGASGIPDAGPGFTEGSQYCDAATLARAARWGRRLNMTPRSRGSGSPRVCVNLVPRSRREQGMPGARCTRGLVCNSAHRKRTRAYRYRRNTPAFPAQWLYGLCRALPGDEFVLPPSLAN